MIPSGRLLRLECRRRRRRRRQHQLEQVENQRADTDGAATCGSDRSGDRSSAGPIRAQAHSQFYSFTTYYNPQEKLCILLSLT